MKRFIHYNVLLCYYFHAYVLLRFVWSMMVSDSDQKCPIWDLLLLNDL